MSVAQTILVVVSGLVSWFALGEFMPALRECLDKTPELMQRDGTSLGPASVNLLVLSALSAALLICFFMM